MILPIAIPQLRKKLTSEGLIDEGKFDTLVAEAERKSQNLLDILISQKIADQNYLNNLIANSLGVERANLESRTVDDQVVRLLPEEVARQRQVIVFNKEKNGFFDVGMANPSDLETVVFLTQYLKGKIKPFLATADDLNRGYAIYGLRSAYDFKKIIDEHIQASLISQTKTIEEAASQLPIVAIVDTLLSYAMSSRASDIHLEIMETETIVRYRVDGILSEMMRIPKAIHPALVARLKLLAALKLDEHLRPQDGRFRYTIASQVVDVRVAVMPTFYGEKVEMRLLETSQKPLSLEELGMLPRTAKVVSRNLQKSYGMVLSCGPTGSGKTTTLYALMNILNKPSVNIVTTEDPIEYNMPYVNQSQINPQAGLTFATSLRAFLRQDPNIIMVGEIRDAETAGIAVQAALTGHLLLSSLHTNDAPTAIPRLIDLKVPTFLVGSVLNVIIAQRLVRKICTTCVYSYAPGPDFTTTVLDQLRQLGLPETKFKAPKFLYKGKGCSSCGGTGYRGRTGLFETLEVTDKLKQAIAAPNFDLDAVRADLRREGMATMFEDGLEKVELAMTTIDEVLRVIRE